MRADILSPENLTAPDPRDRRYANALVFGVHSHWQAQGFEVSAGGDLYVVGPQTGLRNIQNAVHKALGFPIPNVDGIEITDRLRPSLSFEVARRSHFSDLEIRPFVSADLGAENVLRAGVDLDFGRRPATDFRVRHSTAGHRVSAVRSRGETGWRASLGADVARVGSSVFLPATGPAPRPTQVRLRAGLTYHGRRVSAF